MELLSLAHLCKLADVEHSQSTLHMARLMTFPTAFVMWCYNALRANEALSEPAVGQFLIYNYRQLYDIGVGYDLRLAQGESEMPVRTIAIADKRYVNISTTSDWFDAVNCCTMEKQPTTFESVVYNLAVIATNEWTRLKKESEDGSEQEATGGAAGS